eukprot:Skav221456  [mRNA]  locus=scaffold1700:188009:198602:- [translate_table: standard]
MNCSQPHCRQLDLPIPKPSPSPKDPDNRTKFDAFELFDQEQLENMQNEIQVESGEASAAFQLPDTAFSTSSYCGSNPGPACVRVQGLCDVSQDGDYYKHPVCVSGQAQWSKVDGSMRIRYDGDERNGQAWQMNRAGKWLLETDVTDLLSSGAVAKTAMGWRCECNPDRAGDSCEIPLCQVPGVLNARQPACLEGDWIMPNGICTPSCKDGYEANHPSFSCNLAELECTDFDCVFHGTATGNRRPDGSCECVCDDGYTGPQCRSLVGTQLVPDKFRCFGGPTTEMVWCEITQITSLIFSGLTVLGLLVACYTFQRNKAKEFHNYLHHDKLVEGAVDVHGNYNVEEPSQNDDYENVSTFAPELPSLQDEGTYTPDRAEGGLPGQVEPMALTITAGPGLRRGAEAPRRPRVDHG